MDDTGRTLVVFLSMHRCGSSVTASTLHSLGMSLGPFELNEALPSNPHGHFEAVPFLQLNRRIQERAARLSGRHSLSHPEVSLPVLEFPGSVVGGNTASPMRCSTKDDRCSGP